MLLKKTPDLILHKFPTKLGAAKARKERAKKFPREAKLNVKWNALCDRWDKLDVEMKALRAEWKSLHAECPGWPTLPRRNKDMTFLFVEQ